DVDPEVRNAAFKKLFHSDPHFNVMDGLDVYIDDYNTPNPLPVAIMKTLVQARAMGLIDDELKEQDPPSADAGGQAVDDPAADPASDSGADAGVDAGVDARVDADAETGADAGADMPGADVADAQEAMAHAPADDAQPQASLCSAAEPVLVELKLVPDQASNDEPLSAASSAASTAAGSVVPFPRRPGSANPA
ncbi:MAG: DUF3306 domain-containing protein, partial [Betaproteobacteria bacterium]